MERLNVNFEVKELREDGNFYEFEGMASTFGNIDRVNDVMMKGSFTKSLESRMPIILWQHDGSEPVGVPVEVYETEEGLYLKGKMPKDDTFVSGRVMPQLRIGSVKSMSIGFTIPKNGSRREKGLRFIDQVDLYEVSLVTFPANEKAAVTDVKSIDEVMTLSKKELEQHLSDSGFSNKAACYLASLHNPKQSDSAEELEELAKFIAEQKQSFNLNQLKKVLNNV